MANYILHTIEFYSRRPELFVACIVLSLFITYMIVWRKETIARMKVSRKFTGAMTSLHFAALLGVLWCL